MGTAFNNLVNSTVNELTNNVALSDVVEFANMSIASSVSSDKVFEAISEESSSNIFGVYDTKQTVKELSTASNKSSTANISELSTTGLTNLTNKLKTDIKTDAAYDSAVKDVFSNLTDAKQSGINLSNNSSYGEIATVTIGDGATTTARLLETVSLNDSVSSLIPQTMTNDDFSLLKNIFNGIDGLNNFNACPDLSSTLRTSLFNLSGIFANINSLINLLAKYDLSGLINCIEDIVSDIDNFDTIDLTETLVDRGSINSFKEWSNIANTNSGVINKYDSVRRLGSNSSNFSNNSMDSVLNNFNITDKSLLMANTSSMTKNSSILNNNEYTIYNKSNVSSTPTSFANYCFGDTDSQSLISNVPETIFN